MNEEARTTERIQYFVDFLSRDVLGKIANAWEARADKEGAESEICLELARQHSLAVDAAKNGNMPTLDPTHFLPSVPAFQHEIAGTCTVDRTSDGIVSRLWRRAKADVQGLREPASTQAFRSVQYHEAGFECFLPRACELRDEYNAQLDALLRVAGSDVEFIPTIWRPVSAPRLIQPRITLRPIRPNPLIATRRVMSEAELPRKGFGRRSYRNK